MANYYATTLSNDFEVKNNDEVKSVSEQLGMEVYKGEQVSPGFLKKELAVAWAREHYDLHKEQYSIQYVQFWD